MLKNSDLSSPEKPLLEATGHCVACGLCLPHCPTYRKTQNEADSPRGRIMLMSALLNGEVAANNQLYNHLDRCLACRACELACPNDVDFVSLINQVRNSLEPARGRSGVARVIRRVALDGIVASPSGLARLMQAHEAWEGLGGRRLARLAVKLGLSRLGGLAQMLPPTSKKQAWKPSYPAMGVTRGRVALFLGCLARAFDVETLHASVFVLNKLGYAVEVPSGQNCCGALHAGQGELAKAGALARENVTAFSGENWDAVIVTASGCAVQLREYPTGIGKKAENFTGKVREIGDFLSNPEIWQDVDVRPLHEKIAVHESCLLRNALRVAPALYQMLQRIPGVEAVSLAGNDQCCGAGGIYRLTQPEMSERLLVDKVAAMKASGARIIASSNYGCALHLAEGARSAGLEVEVVHPVVLLARQMGYKP